MMMKLELDYHFVYDIFFILNGIENLRLFNYDVNL